MHVLYCHESDVELPHPPSLTRPKFLAPELWDSILSLHIKLTSCHIKVILCKIEKCLLILGTARGCEEQNYIFQLK